MTVPLVQVDELRKTFAVRGGDEEHVAVDDVSFSISQGESIALVGESGSGKTTMARCLVGLETPDGGYIAVCGEERRVREADMSARRRWAKQTQMVFQDPYGSLDPRQTIRQGLTELLGFHNDLGRDAQDDRVGELLELVQLDERQADSRPRTLSGGQRQRASIARALAASPRVLILDEAVAALDVSVQAQILNLLSSIQSETGVTLLFLTHDLAVVRQVADSVLVMQGGHITERGPTDQVLRSPRTDYTRQLIASVPRPGWDPRSLRSANRKDHDR